MWITSEPGYITLSFLANSNHTNILKEKIWKYNYIHNQIFYINITALTIKHANKTWQI